MNLNWSTWATPHANDSVVPGAVLAAQAGDSPSANPCKHCTHTQCGACICLSRSLDNRSATPRREQ